MKTESVEWVDAPQQADEIFSEAVGLECFSYSGQVTNDVFSVFRVIAESKDVQCTNEIAGKLNMLPSHVELIQYILCNNGHAEYGSSPRCCWLTEKGKGLFGKIFPIYDWEDKPALG